jgi:hypothetical protein
MKLKTHNMAHKQRTPFTLKSGNKTSFKAMGSSPMQIRFASPEAGAILPQNSGINGQAMATPASKPQKPQLRTGNEDSIMNEHGVYLPSERMKKHFANMTPEQKFALSSTSVRTPVGASRPQEQGNPVQAPQAANMKQRARGDYENFERRLKGEESSSRSRYGQVRGLVNTNAQAPAQPNTPRVAVQSAPRPDLSGGPRQPMGGLGQPMGGPGFGGPGQLPPNKGRRRPGMGSGMGRARRATGLARRARRAAGLVRRARRSRG